MLSLKEPIKLRNSCSYKLLFEKIEERNKKRITQFEKRKTALSSNQKSKDKSLFDNKFNFNINEDKFNEKDIVNIFYLIVNGHNNEINIDKKIIKNIDNLNINFLGDSSISIPTNNNKINNIINNPYNNTFLNKKKYFNKNVSCNPNYNSNIPNENIYTNYEINKEVNISNLEEEKESISNNIHKLNENNEYALNFLSSSNDSFVKLDNNLLTKARIQKNYFTESYSQALGCDLDNKSKKFNIKNLDDIEIIKEEKEADPPLKGKKNKSKKIDNPNIVLSMRKHIKLLKEKRKSKSLTKELYLINKKEEINIDEITISMPNKNYNNDKHYDHPMFKKAKTKLHLSTNRKKNKNQNIISLNKKKNNKKLDTNYNKNERTSLTQKFSEIKNNTINQANDESFRNTDRLMYDANNKKVKLTQKKIVDGWGFNEKNKIKKYIVNLNTKNHKKIYSKDKKMRFICIREKKNNFPNNSYENIDNESNYLNNNKIKCITLIKKRNKTNKINITFPYNKSKNLNLNSNIFEHYNEKLKNIESINNSRDKNKNNINSTLTSKEKIKSIKLVNIIKYTSNDYAERNNDLLYNKLSQNKNKKKASKTSIQSPFDKNKIIRISKPKIITNNTNINNNNNINIFKSNKFYKKNTSYNKYEYEKIKRDIKNPGCINNKKNKIKRTIFINSYKANKDQKGIEFNYTSFSKDLLNVKNINSKKVLNNSANNINFDKLKENKSYYLYVDINSL